MRTNCSCYVLVCALIVPPPCFVFPVGVSVRIEKASTDIKCPLPVYISAVSAGFPSPAEDYIEGKLDLNEHLITRPSATFMFRAIVLLDLGKFALLSFHHLLASRNYRVPFRRIVLSLSRPPSFTVIRAWLGWWAIG